MSEDEEQLEELFSRRRFGIKPGLEVEKALLRALGHPEQDFVSVHVAGTNGKGSVCAMLARILETIGLKTGLYTSPHLVRFGERIRVNGVELEAGETARLIDSVRKAEQPVEKECGREATFFEFVSAMAFKHFSNLQVNVAVVETGMGGRYDATNVIDPILSVITPVSMEHSEYLGDTIGKIAAEKAGIIKPGVPVVYGRMAAEAVSVIENKARQTGSTPVAVGNGASTSRVSPTPTGTRVRFVTSSRDLGTLSVPVAGNFQVENLLMALVATEQLESIFGISVPDSVLKTALENFDWPGRFQFLNAEPPVIVDSAHNPAASEALAESITSRYGKRPLSLIFGICGDKDVRGFLRPWQDKVQKLWAVDLPNERSMAKEDAAGIARAMGFEVEALDRGTAGEEAMRFTKECGGALCIAGSLFLAGWALENQNMFQLENNRKKAGKDER